MTAKGNITLRHTNRQTDRPDRQIEVQEPLKIKRKRKKNMPQTSIRKTKD